MIGLFVDYSTLNSDNAQLALHGIDTFRLKVVVSFLVSKLYYAVLEGYVVFFFAY